MTIKQALTWGCDQLKESSSSARLDAEILLAHVLKKTSVFLIAHDETRIGFFAWQKYKRLIRQRKNRAPIPYLTGKKEFYFLDFEVNPHVLIPRPDTEVLVEAVVNYMQGVRCQVSGVRCQVSGVRCQVSGVRCQVSGVVLLDVGTGSGCIPIAVLKNAPGLQAVAIDLSENALRTARKNAKKHGVDSRLRFFKSDLLGQIPPSLFDGKSIILTANLPYIPNDFPVNPDLSCEPSLALYGGKDGMEVYRRLFDQLKKGELRPQALFLELFDFQIPVLEELLTDYQIKDIRPMSGKARLVRLENRNLKFEI